MNAYITRGERLQIEPRDGGVRTDRVNMAGSIASRVLKLIKVLK